MILETQSEEIANVLGLKTQAAKLALDVAIDNLLLLDRKQLDYGSKNISGFGLFGVLVRMNDKFERLKKLTLTVNDGVVTLKPAAAQNESLDDTFKDLSNYSLIALLLLSNKWPNE